MKTLAPHYPSPVCLPRLGLNKSLHPIEINGALDLIEASLRCLPIYQCAVCREPKYLNRDQHPFAGICDDCWMHNETVSDLEFSQRHHNELRRIWVQLYAGMKSQLATGRNYSGIRSVLYCCPDWLYLCGVECAFGSEAISEAIGNRYISPNALRWNNEIGLVPAYSSELPIVGDFKGWRNLWASAWKSGGPFSSIVVGKAKAL